MNSPWNSSTNMSTMEGTMSSWSLGENDNLLPISSANITAAGIDVNSSPSIQTSTITDVNLSPSIQMSTITDVNSLLPLQTSTTTDVSWLPENLKKKDGKIPILSDADRMFIDSMKRTLLFPFPYRGMELEVQKKLLGRTESIQSDKPKKAMNNFVTFRSYLGSTAKKLLPNPLNGTDLSRIASYMWNGASEGEKSSYKPVVEFLKVGQPKYIEKRTRKRGFQKFIDCNDSKKYIQKNSDIPSQVNTGAIRIKDAKKEKRIINYTSYYSPSLIYNPNVQPPMIIGYDTQAINQQQPQPYHQQNYIEGNSSAGTYNWSYDELSSNY